MDYQTRRSVYEACVQPHWILDSAEESIVASGPIAGETKAGVLSDSNTRTNLAEAKDYAIKNFAGKDVINKDDKTKILISASAINHALSSGSGKTDAQVATDLLRFLENAKFIRTEAPKQGNKNVIAAHIYAGRFDTGSGVVSVGAVVREFKDGRRYYDHFILKRRGPQ